jgi:hypothetical protein
VDGAIQLLAHLRDPESARTFLEFSSPDQAPELRRLALAGLRWTLAGYGERSAAVPVLLGYLEEDDFPAVVSPTLEALAGVEIPEAASATLIALARSRHPLVRKFALTKMASLHRDDVILALVHALGDPDPMIRQLAARSIEDQPGAWKVIVGELRTCKDGELAWRMVRTIRAVDSNISPDAIRTLAKDAIARLEVGDGLAEPMLNLVQTLHPDVHFDELYARGLVHKQKKRFAEAERCLRPLTKSDRMTDAARFDLAIVSLKNSSATAGAITRDNELPLSLLRSLIRGAAFPVAKKLNVEKKTLEVEDLYYLGFHLVEGDEAERSIGSSLLEDIVRTSPRSKLGTGAKNKLRAEGLLG